MAGPGPLGGYKPREVKIKLPAKQWADIDKDAERRHITVQRYLSELLESHASELRRIERTHGKPLRSRTVRIRLTPDGWSLLKNGLRTVLEVHFARAADRPCRLCHLVGLIGFGPSGPPGLVKTDTDGRDWTDDNGQDDED